MRAFLFVITFFIPVLCFSHGKKIDLGVDVFFAEGYCKQLKGKKVGLVTNHTGVDGKLHPTLDLFLQAQNELTLSAIFTPEHGLTGHAYAAELIEKEEKIQGIPVYSLHGKTRRPTDQMLANVQVLIFDIQDIGCRSYTFCTTLFYVMEQAAKKHIPVIVFDRPNPINGLIVDGPMLQDKWRSFIGYVNVPYCHGMTIGELARFFNQEYKIGCNLKVVPMKGWKREMSFKDTHLAWIPTSPHIPEADTPLFYATTGMLGELSLVSIGIGYTLPFKIVGAPWIRADKFASSLNAQKLPGVHFQPFYFRPQYGLYKGKDCEGVLLVVTNEKTYKPIVVQSLLLGTLKALYPHKVQEKLSSLSRQNKNLFCLACGNADVLDILSKEKYVSWKLIQYQKEERETFLLLREKYLLY